MTTLEITIRGVKILSLLNNVTDIYSCINMVLNIQNVEKVENRVFSLTHKSIQIVHTV